MISYMNTYRDKRTRLFIEKLLNEIDIEKESEKINCYVCKNGKFKIISKKDRYGLYYPTGICIKCGNLQQASYLNSESLNKFYESHYRDLYKTGSPEQLFLSQYFKAATKIESFIGEIELKNILEIGSGPGGILKYFEHKKNSKVLGIDLDQRYLDYGIKNGLELINSDVETFQSKNKYDLIIVCHVLEHLKNPGDLLKNLKSFLNEEGSIYIEVPSLESLKNGLYGGNFEAFRHLAHVSHFTEKSMRDLIYISGYKITNFNNSIQVLIKNTSNKVSQSKSFKYNSFESTENLLIQIQNAKIKNSIILLIVYIYRTMKIKEFMNIVKMQFYKISYNLKK